MAFFLGPTSRCAGFNAPNASFSAIPRPLLLPLPLRTPAPALPLPLIPAALLPNLEYASSNDGKLTRDPNVGVPHLELAASTISCSPAPISSISVPTLSPGSLLGPVPSARARRPMADPLPTSSSADPDPALARPRTGIGTGTATIWPNKDPVGRVTLTTFHPADNASAVISLNVLSWPLNVTCI